MEAQLGVLDFIDAESFAPNIAAGDMEGTFREMVRLLAGRNVVVDAEKAVEVLLEREKLGSTGIGEGIAIPHGKLPGLPGVVGVLGISRPGIDFQALDGEPVHLIFLLLSPEAEANIHLKALARISRLLKSRQFRQELLNCGTAAELYEKIKEEENRGS